MKATASLVNPGAVYVTISIAMRASDWEEIRRQLPTSYPSWAFAQLITDTLTKALGQINAEHESEAP